MTAGRSPRFTVPVAPQAFASMAVVAHLVGRLAASALTQE
jgi:hypothetical protein